MNAGPDDLEGLEETLSILSDRDVMHAIVAACAAISEGDSLRGVEALRALRPEKG